jgi:Mg-chelatase subunit ChlI
MAPEAAHEPLSIRGCQQFMKRPVYPFSAIVGQEKMKTALLLNAVDPSIGGVLIRGHKGTGKTTAVRALTQILPPIEAVRECPYHCPADAPGSMCDACLQKFDDGRPLPANQLRMPLVELPLSATEDRVAGTLHVEHALATGRRKFEPGLMAAANRGMLYVDEVNLLDDHLVDILLDAAASGINVVEREGISYTHPAGFILVGTMNPEEGELRPQFLDRFGLSLDVSSLTDNEMRQAVARRRIAFDRNPEGFASRWTESQALLAQQVAHARTALGQVKVPAEMIGLAVHLSLRVKAQGHRSDIVMIKTATALAAMLESPVVQKAHMAEAARLVLPHRITTVALATPESLQETLEQLLADAMHDASPEQDDAGAETHETPDPSGFEDWDGVSTEVPGSWAASNTDMIFSFLERKKKRFSKPMSSSV